MSVLLVVGMGVLGCNVFGGVDSAPSSVEDLLADARIALTNKNPHRAVRLLETAFEKDSTDVEVRIELANALYAARDIDLFAVRSALEQLNGQGAEGTTGDADADVCTEGASAPRSPERFAALSLDDRDGFRLLAAERERIRRVSRLVVTGVLGRRTESFEQASVEVRAKGVLLAALTRLAQRLVGVREVVRETGSTLYVDRESDPPGALVGCGPTTEARDQVERSLCRHEEGISQAVSWLERRNELLSSGQTSLLLDLLDGQRQTLRTRLSCPASGETDADDTATQRAPVE